MSDRPTNQYRNKNMLSIVTQYAPDCYEQIQTITLNFSETSHGKGPADGIGASFKRTLDGIVKHVGDIKNYENELSISREKLKNIFIAEISREDIENLCKEAKNFPVKLFIGTLKVHLYKWSRNSKHLIQFNTVSCIACDLKSKCTHYSLGKLDFQNTTEIKERIEKKVGNNDFKKDKLCANAKKKRIKMMLHL